MGFEKKIAQNEVEAVLKPPRGLAYRNPHAKHALEQQGRPVRIRSAFVECSECNREFGTFFSKDTRERRSESPKEFLTFRIQDTVKRSLATGPSQGEAPPAAY